ncbi:DUF2946 domain-containing protein [Pseudomonas sp. R5(2019)]|uniref:DUF2946 domain-containing protein n=1 Tax=Pseudomonas sp. R5(2019) TaxID=2697566 RepID=UPI0014125F73|nr:DUF2946 domain-containing protein [Pseudomonas sp. R5(2019)]NBA98370.1 DUF2946 domain-containing protein [Pseudomonas sp. R5(2019)]
MNRALRPRPLIAWMLYASVLFTVLACGFHHGQMSGMNLTVLGSDHGSVKAQHHGASHALSHDKGDPSDHAKHMATLTCPLCSSFGLAVTLNTSSWALDYVPGDAIAPVVVRSLAQPPPRFSWPALNPRAPPLSTAAVMFSA